MELTLNIDHPGRADMCLCSLLDTQINQRSGKTGRLCRVQGQRTGKECGGVNVAHGVLINRRARYVVSNLESLVLGRWLGIEGGSSEE